MDKGKIKAALWALLVTLVLTRLIVLGSLNLDHFDAALVGYAFATIFAVSGITYRYSIWLQRPPTALYWRQGWKVFFHFFNPRYLGRNLLLACRRIVIDFLLNRFIWRRGKLRWAAHWFTMWGCLIATAFVLPLVFGWVHFETLPENLTWYRIYVFGFPTVAFPIESVQGFFVLKMNGLVIASFLVMTGVLFALRRRLADHGAAALQSFGEDLLPLLLLFAISVTGLMLTVSYQWMKGYAYDFLNILHAFTVIFTMLWLPFGKFFHIFQRGLQLGVGFYKDVGRQGEQAHCRRCGEAFASRMHIEDLILVEQQLGYQYEMPGTTVEHYQWICPRCRRALLGLAQGAAWHSAAVGPERNGVHAEPDTMPAAAREARPVPTPVLEP
jgi:hypothetical protein